MAFNSSAFQSAMGKPMGGSTPPPMGGAPKPGLDMDALMGPPGGGMGEDEAGDIEGEMGEAGETDLQQALERAGYQVSPDKLNQIKAILGDAGGMLPEMGEEDEGSELGAPPPPAPGATSKIGKMFGK